MNRQDSGRLLSLDALRGFDILWIMSAEHISKDITGEV